MGHTARELVGVLDVEEEMQVVRREDVATTTDFVQALGPSEDADDDLVELAAGPKEETAVDGAAGDLDQGTAVWDEAESSAHAQNKTENGAQIFWVLERLGFAEGGEASFSVV